MDYERPGARAVRDRDDDVAIGRIVGQAPQVPCAEGNADAPVPFYVDARVGSRPAAAPHARGVAEGVRRKDFRLPCEIDRAEARSVGAEVGERRQLREIAEEEEALALEEHPHEEALVLGVGEVADVDGRGDVFGGEAGDDARRPGGA